VAKVDIREHAKADAKVWAKFFRERNPKCNIPDEVMKDWFTTVMVSMGEFLTDGTLTNNDHSSYLIR
jgi:hypothetical protein